MPYPLTNRLLDCLPEPERNKLLNILEPVPLPLRTRLFEAGQAPRYVHFLTSGLASTVSEMIQGHTVEVGLTGREGLPESIHMLGPELSVTTCFMQLAGSGLRTSLERFQQEFAGSPAIHRLVLRHVQHEARVRGQLAACNRVHAVEERLARWLLMAADRTGELEMCLSQEVLSQMLGTRRSSVTIAAGTLQHAGFIEYHRGIIRIVSREQLEEAACECFQVTHRLFRNLYR